MNWWVPPPPSFPQWAIAAGPNKEKEMWFNGVHKSAFPCCQVRAAHAASPAPPRVCNLVKLQCFQSCLLWELWFLMSSSTVVFRSRLLLGNVYILFYLDWLGPGLICQHRQAEGGAAGAAMVRVCCTTPVHRGQHFIRHKWLPHVMFIRMKPSSLWS